MFDFDQNPNEPCVYKRIDSYLVIFLVMYVDDILLIINDVEVLSSIKIWLCNQFDMKYLGQANYIIRIKLLQDCENTMLGLS